MMPALIYLHGFASSPRSTKAAFFAARAREVGASFNCPDLNHPEFEALTVTRMLDRVDSILAALPDGDVALIGSSLGAFVAVEAAARQLSTTAHPITALVLLAPALDLVPSLERHFGIEGVARWQESGGLDVFHYGDGATRRLGWDFLEDARTYQPLNRTTDVRTLVYQGRRDDAVDWRMVEQWAGRQPHATLHVLDDDHQLTASLDTMWAGTRAFLDAPG
jgi:pimeloyl-ACP methyl ester carboxylesterase